MSLQSECLVSLFDCSSCLIWFLSAFVLSSILQASIHPYHIPPISSKGGLANTVCFPCCRSKYIHTIISVSRTPPGWSIRTSSRGMIVGILMARRHHRRRHATTITLIDTAATSRPSHNIPTYIARTLKATMSRILPTSISTTRYPSPRKRPMPNAQTQGLLLRCQHPCHLSHIFNKYP